LPLLKFQPSYTRLRKRKGKLEFYPTLCTRVRSAI